jgi:cellulose biosynthesis protein BcsQ
MSRPTAVIADADIHYLAPLELQFVKELHEYVDIEVISDAAYFDAYFSVPRALSLLIVGERFFHSGLFRHNIDRIFVLTEEPVHADAGIGYADSGREAKKIFKYTSTLDIFNEIIYHMGDRFGPSDSFSKDTQVILFFSAAGGAGKTVTAIGTAACLAANRKRVIYIDAEHIHTFHGYLSDKTFVSNDVYAEMRPGNDGMYRNIKRSVRTDTFDYLPPFCASLASLNIKFAVYAVLIEQIKASKDYDYVIVDMDSTLGPEKVALFGLADKIVILLNQDRQSVFKTAMLMNSISVNDNDKNVLVCNRYREDAENFIFASEMTKHLNVSEYMEDIEDMDSVSTGNFPGIKGFQKLAYLMM